MSNTRGDINRIVKEQLELLRTEEELKKILEKVNTQINQLLVEELQLKSQDVDTTIQNDPVLEQAFKETIDEINAQHLNLEIRPSVLKNLEETDEDTDHEMTSL